MGALDAGRNGLPAERTSQGGPGWRNRQQSASTAWPVAELNAGGKGVAEPGLAKEGQARGHVLRRGAGVAPRRGAAPTRPTASPQARTRCGREVSWGRELAGGPAGGQCAGGRRDTGGLEAARRIPVRRTPRYGQAASAVSARRRPVNREPDKGGSRGIRWDNTSRAPPPDAYPGGTPEGGRVAAVAVTGTVSGAPMPRARSAP
eukprot:2142551-Alexandrium_andersonii.AAC.1